MTWPDVTDPPHEFEPAYVPVMVEEVACAVPDTLAVHDAYGLGKPPAGTLTEKVTVDPETVPETEPLPEMPEAVSVIVIVPENDESVCVSFHDI